MIFWLGVTRDLRQSYVLHVGFKFVPRSSWLRPRAVLSDFFGSGSALVNDLMVGLGFIETQVIANRNGRFSKYCVDYAPLYACTVMCPYLPYLTNSPGSIPGEKMDARG